MVKKRPLTAKEYAEKYNLSHSHVRLLLREGKIKGEKLGRDWLITDMEQPYYLRERSKKRQK